MNKKDTTLEKKDSGMTANTQTKESSTNGLEQLSDWVSKPDDAVIIDDVFWVKRQRWGTFISVLRDGSNLITSLTEEQCINSTRWYLKAKQDGFPEPVSSYDSVVGGKL